MANVTQEQVMEILDYNKLTGIFTWKSRRGGTAIAGSEAGVVTPGGYLNIKIYRSTYQAHRLAWLIINGYLPEGDIVHINKDNLDNRWSNLKESSVWCAKQIKRNNTSGVPGVSWHIGSQSWVAMIQVNNVRTYLGIYKDFDDAVKVRKDAENGHFKVCKLNNNKKIK